MQATFLVAAPYYAKTEEPLADFKLTHSLKGLNKQGGQIFLYQSKDDVVVPFSNYESYQKELPKATARIFDNRQHFNQPKLPEIIEDIKNL